MSNIDDNQNKINIDDLNTEAELAMDAQGSKRSRKNRERLDLSATPVAHAFKEEILQAVLDEMDVIKRDVENRKGGAVPGWFKTLTKIDKETGKPEWRYNMYAMCDAAISEAIDGYHKQYSEQYMQEQMGRAIYALIFEFVVYDRRAGDAILTKLVSDEFAKLDRQLIMASSSHETRREILFRKMAKWGFNVDWSVEEFIQHARPFYLALQATGKFEIDYRPVPGEKNWANHLVFTEEVEAELEAENSKLDAYQTAFAPMYKVPYDWNINSIGPYRLPRIAQRVPLVRGASPDQKAHIEEAMKTGDMDGILHAINTLQRVPYRINSYVADAVRWIYVVENQVNNRSLADQLKKFPKLVPPSAMHDISAEEKESMDKKDLRAHYRKFFATRKIRSETKRNIKEVRRYLWQVEKLQNADVPFYLPHNMDFRGRVYCVPDFNPQQVDYIRAMFLFENKRPVGNAEFPLQLQLANTFGLTKEGFEARVQWVLDNEAQIIAAGTDFKNTFDFWSKAKEPMQFLAACHEWKQYKEIGPEFESGLPIGQDATQSGIQIFAAAALCAKDGEKVNLRCYDADGNTPTKPFDMYAVCLAEAKIMIENSRLENEQWLANNPITADEEAAYQEYETKILDPDTTPEEKAEVNNAWRAEPFSEKFYKRKLLEAAQSVQALGGEYNRDVIKRQVMTLGYSATQYGFAAQIREDWIDGYTDDVISKKRDTHPFGEDYGYAASNFLADIHMRAIKKTLSSVELGMEFIVDVASVLARHNKQVKFVSRLGFPHFQNYLKTVSKVQKLLGRDNVTNIYRACSERRYNRPTKDINKKKVASGSAPNLVHNTDSTLLLLTMLNCNDDRGITNLMTIHDSFSTTAADVQDLSVAVREEFIALFDRYDLYEDFRKQALAQVMKEGETEADYRRMTEEEFIAHCQANNLRYSDTAYKRHCGLTFPETPEKRNTLNIDEVYYSPFFFN